MRRGRVRGEDPCSQRGLECGNNDWLRLASLGFNNAGLASLPCSIPAGTRMEGAGPGKREGGNGPKEGLRRPREGLRSPKSPNDRSSFGYR